RNLLSTVDERSNRSIGTRDSRREGNHGEQNPDTRFMPTNRSNDTGAIRMARLRAYGMLLFAHDPENPAVITEAAINKYRPQKHRLNTRCNCPKRPGSNSPRVDSFRPHVCEAPDSQAHLE